MKFVICRTSDRSGVSEFPPIDGATEESVIVDNFWRSIAQSEAMWNSFIARGTNHRKEGKVWHRDELVTAWTIEVSSLEQLMQINQDTTDLIIKYNSDFNLPEIEIYDGYRE